MIWHLEGGSLATILVGIGTGGNFNQSMMIFPRTNLTDRLLKTLPDAIGKRHLSSWVQSNLLS